MAKKAVTPEYEALKSKGMKAPRPKAYGELDPSKPPKNKGPMMKDPAYDKVESDMASKPPQHKKKAMPHEEAPEGAKGVNEGDSMELPKHLNERK